MFSALAAVGVGVGAPPEEGSGAPPPPTGSHVIATWRLVRRMPAFRHASPASRRHSERVLQLPESSLTRHSGIARRETAAALGVAGGGSFMMMWCHRADDDAGSPDAVDGPDATPSSESVAETWTSSAEGSTAQPASTANDETTKATVESVKSV